MGRSPRQCRLWMRSRRPRPPGFGCSTAVTTAVITAVMMMADAEPTTSAVSIWMRHCGYNRSQDLMAITFHTSQPLFPFFPGSLSVLSPFARSHTLIPAPKHQALAPASLPHPPPSLTPSPSYLAPCHVYPAARDGCRELAEQLTQVPVPRLPPPPTLNPSPSYLAPCHVHSAARDGRRELVEQLTQVPVLGVDLLQAGNVFQPQLLTRS